MFNEWSTNVPAHCRYELLSVGALMIFIFFGGIASTILLLLMLVCGSFEIELAPTSEHYSFLTFGRFTEIFICKFYA